MATRWSSAVAATAAAASWKLVIGVVCLIAGDRGAARDMAKRDGYGGDNKQNLGRLHGRSRRGLPTCPLPATIAVAPVFVWCVGQVGEYWSGCLRLARSDDGRLATYCHNPVTWHAERPWPPFAGHVASSREARGSSPRKASDRSRTSGMSLVSMWSSGVAATASILARCFAGNEMTTTTQRHRRLRSPDGRPQHHPRHVSRGMELYHPPGHVLSRIS